MPGHGESRDHGHLFEKQLEQAVPGSYGQASRAKLAVATEGGQGAGLALLFAGRLSSGLLASDGRSFLAHQSLERGLALVPPADEVIPCRKTRTKESPGLGGLSLSLWVCLCKVG